MCLVTLAELSLLRLFCSAHFPHSPLEKRVAVWPPGAPLGGWLARVFLEPWNRRDVEHFLKIAERGYRAEDGTLSFHPLYPLLGKLAGLLTGGHELLGLFIVSNVAPFYSWSNWSGSRGSIWRGARPKAPPFIS